MTSGPVRPPARVREAGDSALLLVVGAAHDTAPREPDALPLEPALDPRLNAHVVAVADAVRARRIPGVRDVVPTFRSVAVYFDPLETDVAAVAAALGEGSRTTEGDSSRRVVEVPVTYGGTAGPDLDEVAAIAGCSPEEVVERHASRTYRVFMLGFLPGFPYLGTVDPVIAAPRRATPRVRVPAGSVGIAGRQTGIYPRESPGGWQIIGRTSLELFDPGREPAALFAHGDAVRFVPLAQTDARRSVEAPGEETVTEPSGASFVTVLRPGLLTTVQDTGRWGHQALGVSVSGPMDAVAHRLANTLVGNRPDAAALEATLLGPELRFEQGARIAVAGGDLHPMLDGEDLPMYRAVDCPAGGVLRFGERRNGARAYIGVAGGIAVAPVLGSRATHLFSRLGGLGGRALRSGDRLPLGPPHAVLPSRNGRTWDPDADAPMSAGGGVRLRILAGPQSDHFGPAAFSVLQRGRYTISPQSDRMGFRLVGPALSGAGGAMISDATFVGSLQVPPSGQPILLMADRQTTGGYPQIAVVITADLPRAAQLAPGDWVEFEMCSRSEAIAALAAQEGQFLLRD